MPICTCFGYEVVLTTPTTSTYSIQYTNCSGVLTTIVVDPVITPIVHIWANSTFPLVFAPPGIAYTVTVVFKHKLTACNDSTNIINTSTNLAAYVGQTVKITGSELCWQVAAARECLTNTPVAISTIYTDCIACADPMSYVVLDFISCCGTRLYFQIPSTAIPLYGNVNDTYVYNGPPVPDSDGTIMYPGQCYYISDKSSSFTPPRPTAPAPTSFGPLLGIHPESCNLDQCQHCFYKLSNCGDPEDFIISYSNLSAYLGQVITIADIAGCWIVTETDLSSPTPINVIPIQGYTSCETCAINDYFTINDCCTNAPYTINGEVLVLNYTGQAFNGITPASLENVVMNTISCEGSDPIIGCFILTQIDINTFPSLVSIFPWEIIVQEVQTDPTCEDCQSCQPCYLLTDCDGIIDPIVVDNDLSSFVGNVMELCPSNLPTPILPNPALGNPVDGTFLPGAIYDLIDCCNLLPTISVNLNIGIYAGQILNIPTLSPTTCWFVRKTTLNIQPYVVLNLTGAQVFTSCEICTKGQQTCSQNIPELTECTCFQVSIANDCEGSITLASIGTGYEDCETCIGICYILIDCEGLLPDIETTDDLSNYVGEVIQIKTCPDTCWEVQKSEECLNPVSLPPITDTYKSCEECLPPILPPPPVQLITRRVKPGYYTKGCPPEYTEKISCKFGDTMFNDVASVRYGINICCDHDVDKWWIKKELLNLKAIYDPALDIPVKVCYCYKLVQTAGTTDFKYISCEGDCSTIRLVTGDTRYVCSQNWPNAVCPESGSIYTIESLTTICTDGQSCEPVILCYCYAISGIRSITLSYALCDGTIVTETYFAEGIINICAQQNSITVIEGNVTSITENGLCTETIECLPCNCYRISVNTDAGASITYTNCDGQLVRGNAPFGESLLCALDTPVINPLFGTVTLAGNCESCS